jgi:hypothetical protein
VKGGGREERKKTRKAGREEKERYLLKGLSKKLSTVGTASVTTWTESEYLLNTGAP